MNLRNKLKRFVNSNQRTRDLYNRLVNTYASGSHLIKADNTSFKKNRITIDDSKSCLSLGKNSFLQKYSVLLKGKNNHVLIGADVEMYGSAGCFFHVIGENNTIIIGSGTIIRDTTFFMSGNNNIIEIGDNCSFMLGQFHVEGDNNGIVLGNGVTIHGRDNGAVHMAVDEGSRILIKDDCMLSNDIQIRSTDSHSVVDKDGKRTNPAEDIVIGKHCWIGLRATILKGTVVSDNTVVAAGSILTKVYTEGNCILAGSPAVVVKKGINWDRERL